VTPSHLVQRLLECGEVERAAESKKERDNVGDTVRRDLMEQPEALLSKGDWYGLVWSSTGNRVVKTRLNQLTLQRLLKLFTLRG
jgi:hypothetical protein